MFQLLIMTRMASHFMLKILAGCLLGTFALAGCQKVAPSEPSPAEQPPDRNLAGLDIPRGLINHSPLATPGYVYFTPLLSDTTFLINTNGEVVHVWKSDYGPSGWVYLKADGILARGGKDVEEFGFEGGGSGGYFQEFNWDGELVWQYRISSEESLVHHDVAILPNGNYLAIAWEGKSAEQAIAAGRDPIQIAKEGIWPDWVVEIKPIGTNDAEIVWEWHLWDHLIQDFDSSKANYGDVSAHPELIDINLIAKADTSELDPDLYHTNAINYHPALDQIVLSSPGLDEVIIIDHSTTREEAAGHTGGRWGKGGDILFRWGNPQNYHRGDSSDRKLGGQHDVRWIPAGYPGEGNLMIFNNNVPYSQPRYSEVLELMPPLIETGYVLEKGRPFGPETPAWRYIAKDTLSFYSPFISGAHRMANGNTFITEGARGRFFEVDTQGQVLWEYLTPYAGTARLPDGSFPQPVGPHEYGTFRATHIPLDHPAVAGRELEPLDPQPNVYLPKQEN